MWFRAAVSLPRFGRPLRPPVGIVELETMDEHQHVALPKLHGAPAYARPVPQVAATQRPFDPDDLPLVAQMSEEDEAALAALLNGGAAAAAAAAATSAASLESRLRPRPISLRALTDRLLRSRP